MAKKRSNQIKIAVLVIIGLLILFLGYNFLKGNKLFSDQKTYHSIFQSAKGLGESDKIFLLGVDVGKVEDIAFINNYEKIKVTFVIDNDIRIPEDSKIHIDAGIPGFGSPAMKLELGNSSTFLKRGGEIQSVNPSTLTDRATEIVDEVEPTVTNLNSALKTIDSVAYHLNLLVSGTNAQNIEYSLASLNRTLQNFNQTSQRLNELIARQSPNIESTIENLNSFTTSLDGNKEKINSIVDNLSTTSENLSKVELEKTIEQANSTFKQLNATIDKINNGDGSLSLLINDAELYNNLNNTARDLDRLILQIKEDPNAIIPNISLIGGGGKKK